MKSTFYKLTLNAALFLSVLLVFTSCSKSLEKKAVTADASADLSSAKRSSTPNIILIMADDFGYEIPASTGGETYTTPNLDFMVANGMRFSRFSPHPDGPPSRLALFTGKYCFRNWVEFGFLPPTEKSIGNLLHDANYQTCFVGKWQFDGGDTSIRNHGFDKYRVFMPFNPDANNGNDQFTRRYKNPYLYENGQYLSDAFVEGKYSEDLFFDYASAFIDSNRNKPFFLAYSNSLIQKPWSPTPDNPDFASWNPAVDDVARADPKYLGDMVSYIDKTIGKIITKVQQAGLMNNTIIIFTSDNGTNKRLSSQYKGQTVQGGKGSTIEKNLRVPLFVYSPALVAPNVEDTSLVDMTDFLPTFAEIAKVSKPTTWGTLDGVTFYDNMKSAISARKQRTNSYCYWPRDYQREPNISFIWDYTYKLYDSVNGGGFYNIRLDPSELNPIPNNQLTSTEKSIKKSYSKILSDRLNGK
ncbi:sulfatase-like hydrolase/transferase [Limnovirga soli]|uniref:Sulfatase-like hydrolase/transferase n=1 Tax=Limnovirga soli TaxID=2656915 RepID=A0A8J8FFF4_9BACT|nr:sulfatase-like hydrolase/transferase [Limnovirga soli]NNV55838.1 sulfatase-like hydrolase/transferase [Limnovirga soli]